MSIQDMPAYFTAIYGAREPRLFIFEEYAARPPDNYPDVLPAQRLAAMARCYSLFTSRSSSAATAALPRTMLPPAFVARHHEGHVTLPLSFTYFTPPDRSLFQTIPRHYRERPGHVRSLAIIGEMIAI